MMTRRRPTIRRVRDWSPGGTITPPVARGDKQRLALSTLDDASDHIPTMIGRHDPSSSSDEEKMVATESGIRESLANIFAASVAPPPSSGSASTMEILDADDILEIVPKKSEIRELSPSGTDDDLSALVHVFEERAQKAPSVPAAPLSPATEELDLDAIEEVKVVAKSAKPPPLRRKGPPLSAVALRGAVVLLQRWPELWDLSASRKIAIIALWMFFCSLATLVVTR